ncbi:hypothetical protein [Streptomyces sp. NPDC056527]|uniref:hypothetical protein n=1 Tax=Streptomyces sp. NPDC056527 TaxID=3345853 RepID=UPI0036CD605C
MLPLEAIELDAFRQRHEQDTFWCGLLLGGCGLQLTTKLYTDRVCHFAHYPGPDGHPHLCGRRSRGVASADHLYVKASADAWLRARGTQAGFDFVQPNGVPIGSVVDIQLPHRRLRVHLDQEVAPDWDAEHEPVLGVSVPVDPETLIHRWYVHRIRLDSQGTTRRVRIGTEAFARPTEWFALDDCEITERGLSTPAVERIVQARSAPPPTRWSPGRKQEAPAQDVQAQELLRRLLYARRIKSTDLAESVCREITELSGVSPHLQGQLDAALRNASLWIEKEAETRQRLCADLNQAVANRRTRRVKSLLPDVKAATKADRTEEEEHAVRTATNYLAAVASAANERLDGLVADLNRLPANTDPQLLRSRVKQLCREANEIGKVGAHRQTEIALWSARARSLPTSSQTSSPPRPREQVPLHNQVGKAYWTKKLCPRCEAGRGQKCVVLGGDRAGRVRQLPHDERLQLIINEREERHREQRKARPVWQVYDVTCPVCSQEAGAWCLTPGKPHGPRRKLAEEYTLRQEPRL